MWKSWSYTVHWCYLSENCGHLFDVYVEDDCGECDVENVPRMCAYTKKRMCTKATNRRENCFSYGNFPIKLATWPCGSRCSVFLSIKRVNQMKLFGSAYVWNCCLSHYSFVVLASWSVYWPAIGYPAYMLSHSRAG